MTLRSLIAVAPLLLMTPLYAGEWVDLFDGESLDSWEVQGGTASYRIEDDMIVGRTADGSKNTFLCKGPYSDFELQFDVKCDTGLNSGVQIRSHVYEKETPQASNPKRMREAGEVYGYQCEVAAYERPGNIDGNFWDEGRRTKWLDETVKDDPAAVKAYKKGEWNHFRIVAQGDRIRSWVNGVPVADFSDDLDASGFIGLQVHSIPKNAGPFEVRFKNLKLRELSADEEVE
ncbi:3-keto-disaccharide hydrolase [Calycomorphotria hydatis]|nr:DUF1080 domain-containing protein [Calycomorphotria hydatis]